MRVVWITGATGGLGRSTATSFAKLGDSLVLQYHQAKEKAFLLKKELEDQYQIPVLLVQGDISDEEEVKKNVNEVLDVYGHIDVLVNNAGITHPEVIEEKDGLSFEEVIKTNLIGTYLMSRAIGKVMYEEKSGVIIQVASTNGIDCPSPMEIDYDASKAGIISMVRNLAMWYSPYVRVNAVAPGWVKTEMLKESLLTAEEEKLEAEKVLLKRLAEPEEIASVIVFLASDAASYINGTTIRIDGGY